MLRCCYDIVWDKEQELLKQNKDIKENSLCQKKLKQAEVLARMLNDTAYVEFLSEHRKRLY